MSDATRQWVRDVRKRLGHRFVSRTRKKEPELPYLPQQSAVSWTVPENGTNGTADSALFTRLPPEIRQKILVDAFGDRTLHMNLQLDAPLLSRSKWPLHADGLDCIPRGGTTADLGIRARPAEVTDTARRMRKASTVTQPVWQWRSCVCQRNLPLGDERVVIAPWEDACVRGSIRVCGPYLRMPLENCLIGCSGWLTTCRRAYAEGIQVLYSTNTLFIKGGTLIEALLQASAPVLDGILGRRVLVPPHQMAMLTKLELVWQWALFMRPDQVATQAAQRAEMARSLDLLPRTFPHLATLYFSYLDELYARSVHPREHQAEIERELLLPLYRTACQFGRLRKCVVEIPTVLFGPLLAWAKKHGNEVDKGRSFFDIRFWWQPEPMETGKIGFWIKSGIAGNLYFDYKGEARTHTTDLGILY